MMVTPATDGTHHTVRTLVCKPLARQDLGDRTDGIVVAAEALNVSLAGLIVLARGAIHGATRDSRCTTVARWNSGGWGGFAMELDDEAPFEERDAPPSAPPGLEAAAMEQLLALVRALRERGELPTEPCELVRRLYWLQRLVYGAQQRQ